MDTTKKIHDVSASLFFLIVFAYLFAALAFRNAAGDMVSLKISRTTDLYAKEISKK